MTDTLTAQETVAGAAPTYRTKLIEVALPLEAINVASAREKSIRHGHPSTLHLWWARRPLATCRAVLFAQIVDDPSALPEEFPTEEAQDAERQRIFRIIEDLVQWEKSTNETVLNAARREIARSVARTAGVPLPETPDEVWQVLREHAPPVLDPFCGGGSIPLEAQRLGLEAHASDLNPVAVLITKAMIEIPPKFAGRPPVNPRDRDRGMGSAWKGAAGLAADVRYYGEWMREEAFKRIGQLYPKAKLADGTEATVIAWLWARTVQCPNPACGAQMPLVRSFALSTKKGKETWVEPIVDREAKTVRFEVRRGVGKVPEGTVNRRGAYCIICDTSVPFDHVRAEGRADRMSRQMMAVVVEGQHGRTYLAPSKDQSDAADRAHGVSGPANLLSTHPQYMAAPRYGMITFEKLFTSRQLLALTTFSDLLTEMRELVQLTAGASDLPCDGIHLGMGGVGTTAYADAVMVYLAFALDKCADYWSTIATWASTGEFIRNCFARQAISMSWDFAECNPFSDSTANWSAAANWLVQAVAMLPADPPGIAQQRDAAVAFEVAARPLISTDPPYYDNVPYSDLSDFFYVWLRRSLRPIYPDLFSTMVSPKQQELVADHVRLGGRREAHSFFERGLGSAFQAMEIAADPEYPVAVYYAFKQSEAAGADDPVGDAMISSSGWESMLSGLLEAGFRVSGTWPMRTERGGRMRQVGSNALASSIVLACRARDVAAEPATRREFIGALRREMPKALTALQHGNVAPVDLAQASIGPGMAIFSRYTNVLEADGSPMSVRTALQVINQELDAYLAAQEGAMDPDTRFCVAWFDQYGVGTAKFGEADVLARAKNTSVDRLVRAGVLTARGGEVRLLTYGEMNPAWDPRTEERPTHWGYAQHLIAALGHGGEAEAARLAGVMGAEKAQMARDLAYRLYAICERKGRTEEAMAYNALVVSWPAIQEKAANTRPEQGALI